MSMDLNTWNSLILTYKNPIINNNAINIGQQNGYVDILKTVDLYIVFVYLYTCLYLI